MAVMKNINFIGTKILFVLAIVVGIFGIVVLKRVADCKKWTETEGEIISSCIRDIPVPETKSRNHLTPDIVYEYKATNGKSYFSNNISFVDIDIFPRISDNYYAGNYEELKQFLSKYPLGEKVKVFYNPQMPSLAVLDNGIKMPIFLPLILSGLLFYTGLHYHIFCKGIKTACG
jgi:hypothetical protein